MALNVTDLVATLRLNTAPAERDLDTAEATFKKAVGGFAVIAATAGVAAGAALAAGLSKALDLQEANKKLQAQLGLNDKEFAKYGAAAGKVYSQGFGQSLSEVNDAVGAVAKSIPGMMRASEAELQAATTQALNLAQAFDIDVQSAVASTGTLLQTGLASDATQAFDLITKAAQSVGPGMVDPLLEAVNEYGVNFQALGYSGEQAFAALVAASAGGEIALDKAGDAVKEFTIRATDGSTTTAGAFQTIGLDAESMSNRLLAGGTSAQEATAQISAGLLGIKDPSAQAQAAIALFGTPLEDIGVNNIPLFLEGLTSGESAMDGFAGSADRMGATLNDTAQSRLSAFKRSVETNVVQFLGGTAIPFLIGALDAARPAFNRVSAAVSALIGFVRDHGEAFKAAGYIIGGATLALGAFLLVTVGVPAIMGAAQTAIIATRLAMMGLNAALRANPVGFVITVLGALVGAVIYAWNNVDWFRNGILGAWSAIRNGVTAAWDWLRRNVFDPIGLYFTVILPAAVNLVRGAISGAWESIRSAIGGAWSWIRDNVFQPLSTFITSTIPNAFTTGVAAIGRAWDALKDKAKEPVRFVVDKVINGGIIDTFNDVAKVFGAKGLTRVALPQGFATGGAVHGAGTATSDSIPAVLSNNEHVWTAAEVAAAGGHSGVEALRKGVLAGMDVGHYAKGGGVGDGPGLVGSLTNPFGAIKGAVDRLLAGVGSTAVGAIVSAVPGKILDMVKDKLTGGPAAATGALGTGGGVGGWQWQINTLRKVFPGLALNSGYRPGSITATGNKSMHGAGRAVDVPPRMDVFNWIRSNFGASTKELIYSPAGAQQIHNGKPHVYSGVTKAMHYDHVHWGFDSGGIANGVGMLPKQTIRPERVLSPEQTRWFEDAMKAASGNGGSRNVEVHYHGVQPTQTREQMLATLNGPRGPLALMGR